MNVKISEMTSATSLDGTELVPIVQSGVSKKATKKLFNSYSTTEQVIGTWIDGKPLYRKVFTGTKTSGTPLQFSITNFNQLINAFGYITVNDNGTYYTYPIPYYETSTAYIRFQINSGVRLYSSNGTFINGEVTMVVEYTKTTD